jgi:replicative DNA helicase
MTVLTNFLRVTIRTIHLLLLSNHPAGMQCRDLKVPVLALSQISRGVESRQDKRPMMSDLSQSGILEMVADNIILAYRDEYYNPDTQHQGILELILAKARHGETGTAKVLFDRSYGLIRNMVG